MKTLSLTELIMAYCFFAVSVGNAQVAIGNIDTTTGVVFHVDDLSGTKGILLPEVDIIDRNTITPLPAGSPEGVVVFNANEITGKGHYYWNGFTWIRINQHIDETARFFNDKNIETIQEVNLNKDPSTGGVDVEIFDGTEFNQNPDLFEPVPDVNDRLNGLKIGETGRYEIVVNLGLELENRATGSSSIQARIKISNGTTFRYSGSLHRSTEMDVTGVGDDDGTVSFTEVIELKANEIIFINCTKLEGNVAVYQRKKITSNFTITKIL